VPVEISVIAIGDGMVNEPCWEIQVGAFAKQENVERSSTSLIGMGYQIRRAPAGGGLVRVRITGISGRSTAIKKAESLAARFPGAVAVPCGGGW
jgi:hypothetical protein